MDYREAGRSVGKRVVYTRPAGWASHGVIEAMQQLPLVRFDDGTLLQVSPYCLELADEPTLFGA